MKIFVPVTDCFIDLIDQTMPEILNPSNIVILDESHFLGLLNSRIIH